MRILARYPLVAALTLAGLSHSQLTAAPAAVSTVATAERSAHFDAVNRHLELGGVLYGYMDIDGDVAEGGATLTRFAEQAAAVNPMAALARQDYAKIFADLGLTDVKAVGLSSVKAGDGYRNRVFLYTPEGRRGLLTILGGQAKPFANAHLAPADADLFCETELDVPSAYAALRAVVARICGEDLTATFEQELKKPSPEGVTALEVIQKISGRYTLTLRLDPEKRIPLPNGASLPGVSLFIQADGLADVFKKLIKPTPALAEVTDAGRTFLEVTQSLPGTELKPVFMFEDGAFVVATTRAFAIECLERKAGLDRDPMFTQALASVGPEGNGVSYVTPRLFEELRSAIDIVSTMNPQAEGVFKFWSDKLPKLSSPLVSVRANLPEGILVRSFGYRSLKQEAFIMGNPAVIGLAAAMAIPAFQKVRGNSQEKTIQNNLRQFEAGAQQYMLEHGKDSASYADVVGPEEGKYVRELKPVAGEDYTALSLKDGDAEISVTTAAGKVISLPIE
jgi:hypothetical protein